MDKKLSDLIDGFDLSTQQRAPVEVTDKNVIVSAGAGSGKTRTLVARYAALLYKVRDPRKVVAITFSEKAAFEMRSRVRAAIEKLIRVSVSPDDRAFWLEMNSQVDSARISTIHSLCAEILRAHPAEASIDPRARVMEEPESAAIISALIQQTLQLISNDPHFEPIFENMRISSIGSILRYFIANRLRIMDTLGSDTDYHQVLTAFFEQYLNDPKLRQLEMELGAYGTEELVAENRVETITELLEHLSIAKNLIQADDYNQATHVLWAARKNKMPLTGKKGPIKESLSAFRNRFDLVFDIKAPDGGEEEGNAELLLDPDYQVVRNLVMELFHLIRTTYENHLRANQLLDFDSLEYYAGELLSIPHIRAHWQSEIASLLVDEFQDTNTRQRALVEALTGDKPGKLFMVGDARQSIYRFRQADVTVFRAVHEKTSREGYALNLDISYRTTEALIKAYGVILSHIMGLLPQPEKPWDIQYTELVANRKVLPTHIKMPVLEIAVAKGSKEEYPRVQMGRQLAQRLLEMKRDHEIGGWDDVAILCRATRSYQFYEDAFEEYGIPYVTIAGRGFYQRAEIRDVINLLRALSDPNDDLSMAGLLRSPAIGVSDAALYLLRKGGDGTYSKLNTALHQAMPGLKQDDLAALERARDFLAAMIPLVDRVPVYQLLKSVVDHTHYRTILALSQSANRSGREWRNIDKLIKDCQATNHLILKDYLDFIDQLAEDGVRSGEAPAEAIGAVTIMTIHKSKGLEYPVVVLADAGRMPPTKSPPIFLDPRSGIVFRTETNSLHYKIASRLEDDQLESEGNRLLYVALTRAKDKLIISGHIPTDSKGKARIRGWLGSMDEVLNFKELTASTELEIGEIPFKINLVVGVIHPPFMAARPTGTAQEPDSSIDLVPLYEPLWQPSPQTTDETDGGGTAVASRTSGFFFDESPKLEGSLFHKAVELAIDPTSPKFDGFIATVLASEGVFAEEQRNKIKLRVKTLLERFHSHPVSRTSVSATQRYHELPYTYIVDGRLENGIIDLLFKDENGWNVLDFKTNHIDTAEKKAALSQKYADQLNRYSAVLQQQMGIEVRKILCFLDDHGSISLVELG